jgi:MFS transporter, PPP family, 3-phenylpropionic acid transporter
MREVKTSADRRIRLLFALGGGFTAAILPFLTLLLHSRGFSPGRIGLMLAAEALAAVLAAPVWSHFTDLRLGTPRAMVLMSLASSGVALALIPAGGNPWIVGLLIVGLGIAWAPGPAFADSLALTTLGAERAAEYGRVRLYASAGWAFAVLGFGAIYQGWSLELVLPCYVAMNLAYAFVASRFVREVRPKSPNARPTRALGAIGEAVRSSSRMLPFLSGLLLLSLATSAANAFVPLEIGGPGGGAFLVGLAAAVAAFIEIPIFAASGRLSHRFGMRALCLTGIAVTIAQLVAWSLLRDPTAIAAVRMIGGVSYALTYGSVVVLTGYLVPEYVRNSGQTALQLASWSIGPIVGTAIGGYVYQHLGPGALFSAAAVVAAAGLVVVATALRGVDVHDGA